MSARVIVIAVVWAAVGLTVGPPSAAAESPMTCLAEVAGAKFDALPPFAGRVRPFAHSPSDATIESRQLLCPYVTTDGQSLAIMLEWDERPAGRFECRATDLVIEGDAPARSTLEHPTRQAAVTLDGPDVATVRRMEQAARLTLAAVPDTAASCSSGVGVAESSDGRGALHLAIGLLGLAVVAVVAVVAVRRRSRPSIAAPSTGATDEIAAELARTDQAIAKVDTVIEASGGASVPSPAVVDLVSTLSSSPGGIDLVAATAVAAHVRGRDDIARFAVAARRSLVDGRAPLASGPRRQLWDRILDIDGGPTDGTVVGLLEARRRLVDTRNLLIRRLTNEGVHDDPRR